MRGGIIEANGGDSQAAGIGGGFSFDSPVIKINQSLSLTVTGYTKGLSSKLCMRFLLCYFREPFSVSNVEVA